MSGSGADTGIIVPTDPDIGASTRRRRPKLLVLCCAVWLVTFVLLALLADFLPLPDPDTAEGPTRLEPLEESFVLGTDRFGRDVLARVIFGGRVSLAVGVAAACIAMVAGGLVGLVAGYKGGLLDRVVGFLTDSTLAFPPLVLLLAVAAIMTPSMATMVVGLTVIAIPNFVRLARANTLRFVNQDFVAAASLLGARTRRILFREVLPNIVPPIAAYGLVLVAVLIIAESSLSFLGLGIPPPTSSWGGMIAEGQRELSNHPHLIAVPSIVLFVTVFSLNAVGEWLTAKADRRAQR